MQRAKSCLLFGMSMFLLFLGACAGHEHKHHEGVLPPPAASHSAGVKALVEGNKLFADHRWTATMKKYQEAIQADPSLAEAHYNLAVTLDQQGRFSESRPHYFKAANLAPGNKVIWNAPPFREYGTVETDTTDQAPDEHMGHQH